MASRKRSESCGRSNETRDGLSFFREQLRFSKGAIAAGAHERFASVDDRMLIAF